MTARSDHSPFDLSDTSNKREIGSKPGTLWSLSSQKPGHGVLQLRNPDLEQLWQSDGTQPHRINVEFSERTAVTHVSLWLNVRRDDSYTPTKILVEAGTDYHDLTEVRYREWVVDGEPYGWKHFYLSSTDPRTHFSEEDEDEADDNSTQQKAQRANIVRPAYAEPLVPIHTWMLQISVLANHQNGKDTHVRGCLVWGPSKDPQRDGIIAETIPVRSARSAHGVQQGRFAQDGSEEDEPNLTADATEETRYATATGAQGILRSLR
ncbi:unnamed protein product [Parajaminaea phylloscopi]